MTSSAPVNFVDFRLERGSLAATAHSLGARVPKGPTRKGKALALTVIWRVKIADVVTSGLIGVLVLLVVGCAGPPPEQSPPPPPMATAEAAPPPASPDLGGGPPPAQAAAPPTVAPGPNDRTAGMAPIPNPEDMTPQERERVYGHRYDHPAASAAAAIPAMAARRHRHLHQWARNTHVWRWTARAGIQPHHERRTQRAAAAGSVPVLRPSLPAPTPATAAAGPSERLTALQTALRGPVADAAGFVVSDDLAAGKPGSVSLTLPADLYARLRSEAAKAGLAQDARSFDIQATLSGDGYVIAPAGPQAVTAPAADAAAASPPAFAWQVQPQAGGALGPLRAELTAQLRGAGAAQALPLLSLERPIKPAQPAAQTGASGEDLFNLHLGEVDLPGLGKTPVSSILAVLLLILVVVVLVGAARHTAERERADRRKARATARAAMLAEETPARQRAEAAAVRTEAARSPELV